MRKEYAGEARNRLHNLYQHLTVLGFITKEPQSLQAAQWVISCATNFDNTMGKDTKTAWEKYKATGFDENEYQNFMEWVYKLDADLDTYFKSEWNGKTQIVADRKYINDEIIKGFQSKVSGFDYQKLITLMEEINLNYSQEKVYSSSMLLRAILDHIPPLLGKNNFNEIVAQYNWGGSKSSKLKAVKELLDFRNIPDNALHNPASNKSDVIDMSYLPNKFNINTLLQECLSSDIVPSPRQENKTELPTKKVKIPDHYPAVGVIIETSGGNPYGIQLSFVNSGDKPAILEELCIGNELKIPLNKQGMLPANNIPKQFGTLRLEGNEIHTGKLTDATLSITYRDMVGVKYKTTYKILTKLRADELFNVEGLADLNVEVLQA